MSWTLFAQIVMLVILVYLCLRGLINRYYEESVAAKGAIRAQMKGDIVRDFIQ